MSKKIDLAWMIRTGRAKPGQWISGSLSWNCGGEPAGSISYSANMEDPSNSILRLSYSRAYGDGREHVEQTVRLVFTEPNFGGRRWWMVCPYKHVRVAKLYLPNGGDRFASRKAWRLAYNSQRVAYRDRAFEKLFRLQRKLGCEEGFDAYIRKPKGMWQRTFDRYLERYEELDAQCAGEMMSLVLRLGGKL
ncbi:hypothetical protein G7077_11405 [Sphingomonas piscis]|uniref:Uncharacterized protein n=1 Tax=Sphingomonas piscis TaxID=2714943 RepID=A0A6G7YRP5_9SPHN|nr:hypothetical protein [Sphingomonas piscis]QIK79418.1 hypothetical protein G7077_11405 [Sphingomonas piscis]